MLNLLPAPLLLCIGASFGALSRWQLELYLNNSWQIGALGTLLANWLGCFLMGIALGLSLNDSTKLMLITGFLGSFTTFSAFSAEVVEKLLAQKYLAASSVLFLHLIGGLLLTFLGLLLMRLWRV